MFKAFYLTIIFLNLCCTLKAQVTRGAIVNEIYINTDWYCDKTYCYNGLFYSNDNGQTLEVQYKYSYSLESNLPLGEVFCDAYPGILFNKPFYQSDFMVSYDYGESWEIINTTPSNGDFTGGSVLGELFKFGFSTQGYLLRSDNYALSFDTINSGVKYSFEVGVSPGVLYGKSFNPDSLFRYSLYISQDSGSTFSDCFALDTLITGSYVKDIYRGANPGEIYLVSFWPPDNFKIFFSADDGHTWQYRYITGFTDGWSFSFTPGRENGSFYISRVTVDPTLTHTLLYIDYSSDTAHTFTTFFHDLTPTVGIPQKFGQSDNVDLICYPNPTEDLLYIKNLEAYMTNKSNSLLEIYDFCGNKMEEFIIYPNTNEFRINTTSYLSGLYFIRLMSEKGQNIINKFIISR